MTDKEFKRLSRSQLIDIIYQLQLQVDELTQKNQSLEAELTDRRLRIQNAGDIAHAALEMNNCFHNAQKAANQFLEEIRAIREDAEAERQKILEEARAEATAITESAKSSQGQHSSSYGTEFERLWSSIRITGDEE